MHPILLSTWSFGLKAGRLAWESLDAGGAALDAAESACVAAEEDPEIDSVGFGGLPDRDGRVSLDGCVMLSPRRCGSVCCVRTILHPVSAARLVMERTPHVMLAGPDADAFAATNGIAPRELLSPAARDAWLAWNAAPRPVDQSRDSAPPLPVDRGPLSGGRLFGGDSLARLGDAARVSDAEARFKHHDTIGVLAIDRNGILAGACSTSGTPFKLPGRVGDSPIIGHGLYVDPAAGAATATGAGELIMGVCGSFLAVELMRCGRTPREAAEAVVRRIADSGPIAAHQQVAIVALRADGHWAAAALRIGYRTTVWSREGGRSIEPDVVALAETTA